MKYLIDAAEQTLHFAWAFIALFPVIFWEATWWSGALSGLLLCLPRELVDQFPIERPLDTVKDISFFILGGIAVTWVKPAVILFCAMP